MITTAVRQNDSVRAARFRQRHSRLLDQHRRLLMAQPDPARVSLVVKFELDRIWMQIQENYRASRGAAW